MKRATLKPQLEKRGRHPIDAEILRFIEHEGHENRKQRPEDRLPRMVLAHRIHEGLLKENKGKKRARIPKVSTIAKKLAEFDTEPDKIDGPWGVLTLGEFPISAAALSVVLRAWVAMREAASQDLTIREAQWIARLYLVTKGVSFDYLLNIARMYAEDERVDATTNLRLIRDRSLDLSLFEALTGQKVDSKRATKILGRPEIDVQLMERMLFGPNWHPMPELGEMVTIREALRDIGGKNERTIRQRQSTKEKGHRQRNTSGQG